MKDLRKGLKAFLIEWGHLNGVQPRIETLSWMSNLLPNLKRNLNVFSKVDGSNGRANLLEVDTLELLLFILSDKITAFSELLSTILEKPEDWWASELIQTKGFVAILEDFQFKFLFQFLKPYWVSQRFCFGFTENVRLIFCVVFVRSRTWTKQFVDIERNTFEGFYWMATREALSTSWTGSCFKNFV